jgi:hypothetical protein
MRSILRAPALALAISSLCWLSSFVPLSGAPAAIELSVWGRRNATPTVAADGEFVAVVWGGAESSGSTDIFAAVSRDGGRTFGAPVRVNDVDGDARVNGEQPPHVALVARPRRDPAIVIVWTTKGANGTKVLQSRSDDGGRSYAAEALVPGTDGAGNRGWQAIAVEPGGRVDAIWLDHRELAHEASMTASHHDHKGGAGTPDGVAMAQKSKLFFASLDGALAPRALTGGVCYCCKTALVSTGGAIYAAWRHVYPGNLRDMAFTMSRDGGRTFSEPLRVSEDKWALEGCPDDGPAMAVDTQNRVHIVWPTLVAGATAAAERNTALFYAMSSDGKRFTPRQRIPTEGTPHHPRIAIGADGALTLAWDELANGARQVAVGRGTIAADGHPRIRREALTEGVGGVYPALAAGADAVVAAWAGGTASTSSIQVRRLAASRSVATGQ